MTSATAFCLFSCPTVQAAGPVRLHGSVALAKTIESQKAAIESQSGAKLEVVGNGAGRGLADLNANQAELGLLAGALKPVADAMNKEKAGSVEITGMKEIPLSTVKVVFLTHAAVGLKAMTDAQARDVLMGKVTNWKEVGGPDLPIKVVLPFGADGARVAFQAGLLQGADYTKNAITRNSAKDIASVVSQLAGACSVLSVPNVEGAVTVVKLEQEQLMPLQLVVKGDPSAEVQKVIDAVKAAVK